MTENRDVKRAARALAKQKNISYTAALRELAQRHTNGSWADNFLELIGMPDPSVARGWESVNDGDPHRLRVPFGFDMEQNPVWIDLKEGAEGGVGPHGLCVGVTGSGKSVFLRALVLAACATFSPNVVNLLCIDVKGGAAFHPFRRLPHVATCVGDVGTGETSMLQRLHDAVHGEIRRRHEFVHKRGFKDVRDYELAREQGRVQGPVMPTLLVIVDGLDELVLDYPAAVETLAMIGRLGRSLRIHMLLSALRFNGPAFDALAPHLSYRLALPNSVHELSRLGVPAGTELPLNRPGEGVLLTGGMATRVRVACVEAADVAAASGSLSAVTGVEPTDTVTAIRAALSSDSADETGTRQDTRGQILAAMISQMPASELANLTLPDAIPHELTFADLGEVYDSLHTTLQAGLVRSIPPIKHRTSEDLASLISDTVAQYRDQGGPSFTAENVVPKDVTESIQLYRRIFTIWPDEVPVEPKILEERVTKLLEGMAHRLLAGVEKYLLDHEITGLQR